MTTNIVVVVVVVLVVVVVVGLQIFNSVKLVHFSTDRNETSATDR